MPHDIITREVSEAAREQYARVIELIRLARANDMPPGELPAALPQPEGLATEAGLENLNQTLISVELALLTAQSAMDLWVALGQELQFYRDPDLGQPTLDYQAVIDDAYGKWRDHIGLLNQLRAEYLAAIRVAEHNLEWQRYNELQFGVV